MTDDTPEEIKAAQDVLNRTKNGQFSRRVSGKVRDAIEIMAYEGIDIRTAAQRVGVRPDSLKRSFKLPHVRNAYNQTVKDIRDNAAQSAYLRINNLAGTTQNERMRFDASRWVAGVDGIAPVQKVQGQHIHKHSFADFDYEDVTPNDDSSSDDHEE